MFILGLKLRLSGGSPKNVWDFPKECLGWGVWGDWLDKNRVPKNVWDFPKECLGFPQRMFGGSPKNVWGGVFGVCFEVILRNECPETAEKD